MSDGKPATSRSPAEAEADIAGTRVELARTLDAIERRLNARYLVEKGLDMFKDNFTGRDALNRGVAVARANPVPFALMGIGAAWLLASSTNVVDRLAQDERVDAARRRIGDFASDIGNRAGTLASDVAERVGIAGSSSSADERPLGHTGNPMVDQSDTGTSDGWIHQVSGMAQGALRSVRDSGGEIMNRAGSYAGDGAGRVADQLTDALQRHPLLLGAIGAMAGALIASLLPLTRVEDEWIGGTRDEIWNRAEELGQEAVSRVREAAANTAVKAVDAAASAATETLKEEIKQKIIEPTRG